MATHLILRMGDHRLMQVAAPVGEFDTAELRTLIADMFDTMRAAGGCGLAAPQIGVSLRVVVYGLPNDRPRTGCEFLPDTVLINPSIRALGSESDVDWEGCLSVPGLRGRVRRPNRIHCRAFDPEGRLIDREVAGFEARVIQHECDHLDGVLYPGRVEDWSWFGFSEELDQRLSLAAAAQASDTTAQDRSRE